MITPFAAKLVNYENSLLGLEAPGLRLVHRMARQRKLPLEADAVLFGFLLFEMNTGIPVAPEHVLQGTFQYQTFALHPIVGDVCLVPHPVDS